MSSVIQEKKGSKHLTDLDVQKERLWVDGADKERERKRVMEETERDYSTCAR